MKIHPYANLFPMQSDEEIQTLADDIAKHGLRQPIVIDADEMILDGRNRSLACAIAQVKPIYEPFVGTDAEKLAYVVSVNVHRRHLSTEQRAEIAAKMATMSVGDNQHSKKKKEGPSNDGGSTKVSTKAAAKLMNVSTSSVERAKAKAKPAKSAPAKTAKAAAAIKPKPDSMLTASKADEIVRLYADKATRTDQVINGIRKAFAIVEQNTADMTELVQLALTMLTEEEITDVFLISKGTREKFTVPIKNPTRGN